ncbi:alpha/beta fold hydrolase [Streptomyces rubellomurinus]|uniref:Alpha/beta hydrolase n=1 Tax=Streptomyces rubellomurinus (strain ATCC 31215) TaxID=359131 RepID=A0A0F2TLR4_STRR3|nr:alpha/beta fold hydrolase [Streptomyces rubellomurinus]KJS63436.1 alpha/beta hydrolase [Streptomyces rubellomurinus]
MRISEFRNSKAEARYRTAYERALARLWRGERTSVDITTGFGTTRVHRAGTAHGEPIVLLPGSGGNSLMWHAYIEPLAARHPVIAVDTLGEPGAGVQTSPVRDAHDAADWLEELLAALDVPAAHLVGCSYGGWIALHHQIRHPGRTATLTLVDSAGLADLRPGFYRWLVLGGMAAMAPRRLRHRLARRLGNSALLDDELMTLLRASTGFRRRLPLATTLTDDELRAVSAPVLALLGERSALHDAPSTAERLHRLLPAAEIHTVPGAGHSLTTDDPAAVLAAVLSAASRRAS